MMKSGELDIGPIMIIVFGCLAITMSFIGFGLGYVNLARAVIPANAAPAAGIAEADRLASERAKREILVMQRELESLSAQFRKKEAASAQTSRGKDELRDELAELRAKAAELASQNAVRLSRNGETEKDLAGKTAGVKEAEYKVADGRRRLADAERKIGELRRTIEDSKGKFDATRLGGSMKNPQYIECRKDEVVLQPQGERITVKEMKSSDSRFVNAVRRKEVFFLVRPSGFRSFDAALVAAENLNATVGLEPVDEDKQIKFK